jgi:hypothetical protein
MGDVTDEIRLSIANRPPKCRHWLPVDGFPATVLIETLTTARTIAAR